MPSRGREPGAAPSIDRSPRRDRSHGQNAVAASAPSPVVASTDGEVVESSMRAGCYTVPALLLAEILDRS